LGEYYRPFVVTFLGGEVKNDFSLSKPKAPQEEGVREMKFLAIPIIFMLLLISPPAAIAGEDGVLSPESLSTDDVMTIAQILAPHFVESNTAKVYDTKGRFLGKVRAIKETIQNSDRKGKKVASTKTTGNYSNRRDSKGRLIDFSKEIGDRVDLFDRKGRKAGYIRESKGTMRYFDPKGKLLAVIRRRKDRLRISDSKARLVGEIRESKPKQ